MVEMSKLTGRLGNQMFQYAYLYSRVRRGKIPDVYVQDPSYFSDYAHEIRSIYQQGVGEPIDMVAVHVRRGDYVDNDFYVNLCWTSYYTEAMNQFPKEDFFIFSDDIEWCKKQPMFEGCEFSVGRNEIEDMNLMAACKGHIIANSSYSYWAALISPYTQKVIAPSVDKWYTDGIERTVCPITWKRM